MKRPSERGNVIVIILIAIILFGAITFVFTQNNRGATGMMSQVQADAYATEIIAFGNEIKQAAKRMTLLGVEEDEIQFSSSLYRQGSATLAAWPSNPNCTENKCSIFNFNGGQITAKLFDHATVDNGWQSSNTLQEGHPHMLRLIVDDVGTAAQDLVMQIWGISPQVCNAINKKLDSGVSSSPNEPNFHWGHNEYWDLAAAAGSPIGDDNTTLSGQQSGCYRSAIAGNIYYHVIVAR